MAKRNLCAVNPKYFGRLGTDAPESLALQGGPLTADAVAEFERNPYYKEAVRLRAYDDTAKEIDKHVPGVEHYRDRLIAAIETRP